MGKMKRLVKLEGFGNVQMAEDDVPSPAPDEVLVQVKRSLVSRGSELFRRYVLEEAVPHRMMGYSDSGDVVDVGSRVKGIEAGQRAGVTAPHAQYAVGAPGGDAPSAFVIPDGMSYETATFITLATSSVIWARSTPIEPGDTVVVVGQGVVGMLYAQAVRERRPGRVIAVDATTLRCRIAGELGAEQVINARETDSVQAVKDLTGGEGADVVVECVGGTAGVKSFEQALEMTRRHGVIHLIAKYQPGPMGGYGSLPLDSSLIQRKMLIVGMRASGARVEHQKDAIRMLMDGSIRTEPMITHRLPWEQTPEAYHMLYRSPEEALGVILEWDR